jgi:UDP-galactopyranose mutase
LSWRTLDLESEVIESEDYQGTSVMNFADETVPYTRIHEFKHFHPERKIDSGKTFISREYSRFARESDLPYYPVGTDQDKLILSLYQKEALQTKNVHFLGRLGNYKYMDMHQAIGAALLMYERDIKTKATGMSWTPVFSNKNSNE